MIKKQGTDVTIVSFGKIIKVALAAAAELEKDGISVEIVDLINRKYRQRR